MTCYYKHESTKVENALTNCRDLKPRRNAFFTRQAIIPYTPAVYTSIYKISVNITTYMLIYYRYSKHCYSNKNPLVNFLVAFIVAGETPAPCLNTSSVQRILNGRCVKIPKVIWYTELWMLSMFFSAITGAMNEWFHHLRCPCAYSNCAGIPSPACVNAETSTVYGTNGST